jgi:hypothetical protein
MKKLLALVLISALGYGYVSAHHEEGGLREFAGKKLHAMAERKAEKIADFTNRLMEYKIKLHPQFVKDTHELWADKAELHAKMALECARNAKDPRTSEQYKEVATTLGQLSRQIRDISIPNHDITKTFKYAVECLKVKAQGKALASKLWHKVYKQTGDEFAHYMAKRTKMMALAFKQAVEFAENTD